MVIHPAERDEVIRKYLAHRPETYDRLNARERIVLKARWAPGDSLDRRTLSAVAKELGTSREFVRILETTLRAKLWSWSQRDVARCPHCSGLGFVDRPADGEEVGEPIW